MTALKWVPPAPNLNLGSLNDLLPLGIFAQGDIGEHWKVSTELQNIQAKNYTQIHWNLMQLLPCMELVLDCVF